MLFIVNMSVWFGCGMIFDCVGFFGCFVFFYIGGKRCVCYIFGWWCVLCFLVC